MRVMAGKVMVEPVGCQYCWDEFPSPTPLAFFV